VPLVVACRPVLRRWEGHGAGWVKEGHLPSVDAVYCDAGWACDGDV
jgi:hypothetical protein